MDCLRIGLKEVVKLPCCVMSNSGGQCHERAFLECPQIIVAMSAVCQKRK